jgi:hypothetical protein
MSTTAKSPWRHPTEADDVPMVDLATKLPDEPGTGLMLAAVSALTAGLAPERLCQNRHERTVVAMTCVQGMSRR